MNKEAANPDNDSPLTLEYVRSFIDHFSKGDIIYI